MYVEFCELIDECRHVCIILFTIIYIIFISNLVHVLSLLFCTLCGGYVATCSSSHCGIM